MIAKMVNNPTERAKEREKALNKKIEKIFELDSFQRMVENSDLKSKNGFKDLAHSKNFIKGSAAIQKSVRESIQLPE